MWDSVVASWFIANGGCARCRAGRGGFRAKYNPLLSKEVESNPGGHTAFAARLRGFDVSTGFMEMSIFGGWRVWGAGDGNGVHWHGWRGRTRCGSSGGDGSSGWLGDGGRHDVCVGMMVAMVLLIANWLMSREDILLASAREEFWRAAGLGRSEPISAKGKFLSTGNIFRLESLEFSTVSMLGWYVW